MLVDAFASCKNSCSIFADDTNIWLSCKPNEFNNCIDILNTECVRILTKLEYLGLNLSPDKTKAIVFASPYNLSKINMSYNIIINNTVIPFSMNIKILGVTLSNDLSWNHHIANICRNVNFTLHRLYRIGFYFSVQKHLLIYLIISEPLIRLNYLLLFADL